ncbi:hypothetical protein Tco_0881008 [Tanacetum coccineum]
MPCLSYLRILIGSGNTIYVTIWAVKREREKNGRDFQCVERYVYGRVGGGLHVCGKILHQVILTENIATGDGDDRA